jgi:hypothetical protein
MPAGEYRQVVLLGDGFDTRPFRLPWPPGTVLFVVAPPEAHERAEALLSARDGGAPRVERGCLLRRVDLNLAAASAPAPAAAAAAPAGGLAATAAAAATAAPAAPASILLAQLERAGFRGDRLSLWALQGLHGQELQKGALLELLADVTNGAAFHSLAVGELPLVGLRSEVDNALAEVGLLGASYAHGDGLAGGGYGRLLAAPAGGGGGAEAAAAPGALEGGAEGHGDGGGAAEGARERWLFASQQMRMSLAQMGIYQDHVGAAEETDEDFFGHFS